MAEETVLNSESILSEINERAPELVLPSGYVCQGTSAAMLQSKDDASMSATFAIVTRSATPNRYGNQLQLLPNANGAGPVTEYYSQNPVVLYDHGMSGLTLPVGLSKQKDGPLSMAWSSSQGVATCYFSQQAWAEPIYAAVSEGLLKMASVGFDPILAMRLKPAQPQQAMNSDGIQDMTYLGMDFTQWELLEWSIVPIGADRGALRQCLDRGKIHDVKLPQFLRQSFARHAADVVKTGRGMSLVEQSVSEEHETVEQAMPKCAKCGSKLQCVQCLKQTESEPDPNIAPDTDMAYPAEVAQHCATQLQAKLTIQQAVTDHVKQAIQAAVTPVSTQFQYVCDSLHGVAKEFQRMTGRIDDQNGRND